METKCSATGKYTIYFPAAELPKISDSQWGLLNAWCRFILLGDTETGVYVSEKFLDRDVNEHVSIILDNTDVMYGRRELVLEPSESYPGSYNIRF